MAHHDVVQPNPVATAEDGVVVVVWSAALRSTVE